MTAHIKPIYSRLSYKYPCKAQVFFFQPFRKPFEHFCLTVILFDIFCLIFYKFRPNADGKGNNLQHPLVHCSQVCYIDSSLLSCFDMRDFINNEGFEMDIEKLDAEQYMGRKFTLRYMTNGYYNIRRTDIGFQITYEKFEKPTEISFSDYMFNEWLKDPIAYGAFENGQLLGYVEGTMEKWNNRYRISNICVFDHTRRHSGIGTVLMNTILQEAKESGARMVVLETQTCNENAIAFYRKNGFDIIGFDLFAYTNIDPERHEIRIEMGKQL